MGESIPTIINGSVSADEHVQRVERFVALAPGQFWRMVARHPETMRSKGAVGQILLIMSVDHVDGVPHTVSIHVHPSELDQFTRKSFVMRVPDFMECFEHVDEAVAKADRAASVQRIQGRIGEAQEHLSALTTDMPLLDAEIARAEAEAGPSNDEKNLPVVYQALAADVVGAIQTGQVTALMSPQLKQDDVERIQSNMMLHRDIAIKRSDMLTRRTLDLTRIAAELTPYFQEQSAIATAMTKEMRDNIDDLMKGIGTLNLYVLKNVEIHPIAQGASASKDIPLTVCQRILFMDEEMAVYAPVDEDFDFRSIERFFETLGETTALTAQIFPAERCVVGMSATQDRKNYMARGYSAQQAYEMDLMNSTMYLLVRDGENVYAILSPELWHQQAEALFPTKDQRDRPFTGIDGQEITYEDVRYTDALKKHEHLALTYKRLLVLLCGLDHSKQLFGEFYDGPPSMAFVSMAFQEHSMRFIHDLDGVGLLAGERPIEYAEWLAKLNQQAVRGARVLMYWPQMLTHESAPSMFERPANHNNYEPTYMLYTPADESDGFIEGVLRKDGRHLVIDARVSGESRTSYDKREFNAKINVSVAMKEEENHLFMLDHLNAEEAEWYLHDRPSRKLNLNGIRLLKRALVYAQRIRDREMPVRVKIKEALSAAEIPLDLKAEKIIDQALGTWRCANPNKDLVTSLSTPKALTRMLDQVWVLLGQGRNPIDDIVRAERDQNNKLLRISVLPNGKYAAYSDIPEQNKDHRMEPFSWVNRTIYSLNKSGVSKGSQTFRTLLASVADESIVFTADGASEFTDMPRSLFDSPRHKADILNMLDDNLAALEALVSDKVSGVLFESLLTGYEKAYDEANLISKAQFVIQPDYLLPLGVFNYRNEELRPIGLKGECINLLIWACDTKGQVEQARKAFIKWYSNKPFALEQFEAKLRTINQVIPLEVVYGYDDKPLKSKGILVAPPMAFAPKVKGAEHSLAQRFVEQTQKCQYAYLPPAFEVASFDALMGVEAAGTAL